VVRETVVVAAGAVVAAPVGEAVCVCADAIVAAHRIKTKWLCFTVFSSLGEMRNN
jgi:hypothetical protein